MPFPTPDLTGWGGPQSPGSFSAQPPQYILDAIGPYDQSKYRWDQNSMSLIANDGSGSYNYSHLADPSLGTNVITYPGLGPVDMVGGTSVGSADPYGFSGGQVTNFSGTPFTGFAGGGNTFISDDPNAINEYQHDARTRNLQGVAQIGALVAGGAALNGLGGAAAGGGASPDVGSMVSGGMGPQASLGATTTAAPAGGAWYPELMGGASANAGLGGAGTAVTSGVANASNVNAGLAGGASGAANFFDRWGGQITGGVNGLLGASAANSAVDAESEALQRAIDEQRRQFDLSRSDAMPWLTAGQGALSNLQNPNAFAASPGYEWARSEGQRDIGNSFAARGGAASGNALKALSEFNTGLAQQDYGNWWNRQAGLAGVGQNTALNLGSQGQRSTENIGNYLGGQGASRASGIWDRNASLAQGLNQGVSNWLYRRRAA